MHIDNQLFTLLKVISEIQQKQKQRGLNNYNIVNVVRKATHEVGMHSNVIYSLINPESDHFQKDLFLNLFLKYVIIPKLGLQKIQDFGVIHSVQAEEQTEHNRRIDFTIKSDKYLIGIEMKVNASDLQNQISDYYVQLEKESDLSTKGGVYIFYLTKFGIDPSKKSIKVKNGVATNFDPSKHIKCISFKDEILKWLNSSQKEVSNITNLNIALSNYKEIVQKITHIYKGNVMTIEDELLKKENEKELEMALLLDKKMPQIKAKILYRFFEQLSEELAKKDYTESNLLDNYPERYLTEQKCINFFNKGSNRPKFFGKIFESGKKEMIYIYVAVESLCFSTIEQSSIDIDFNASKISTKKFHSYIKNEKCHIKVRKNMPELLANKSDFIDKLERLT